MQDVRFREGEGFEGKCERCLDWWPMDGDFWEPRRGFRRCRACHTEVNRLAKRLQRTDEAYRQREAQWQQRYYEARRGEARERYREAHARRQRERYRNDPVFREIRLERSRAWAAAHPERRAAYMREWYLRRRAA